MRREGWTGIDIGRVLEEQGWLRAQIEELKHEKDDEKKDDAKDKGDEKKEKKPSLKDKLRTQWREHPKRSIAVMVGAAVVIVGGILLYLHTQTYEKTDDAQIDADISAVSARVSGTVVAVHVVDNQQVHAGDLIAELDPRDLDAAVLQARAQLAQAEAQLRIQKPNVPIVAVNATTQVATSFQDVATANAELASAQRDYEKAKTEIDQAEANDRYAQVEKERMTRLASIGAVAESQADQRSTSADASKANVASTQRAAEAQRAKVAQAAAQLAAAQQRSDQAKLNAPKQVEAQQATVAQQEAAVEAAKAQLQIAELNRSYAAIIAPVDGIIGKKSVNIGDRAQPGQQLVAITQTDHVWVTANYRETQLRKMAPSQSVVLHVDALDLDFTGKVESMPGATGSKYSLLPPENATGNYVKVVQRLPVRITIDPNQQGHERLRPGMSVEPKVTFK